MFVSIQQIAKQHYVKPADVENVAKIFDVTKRAFSIALLEARWDSFDT
jgi:hypothetical protein